jgi:hypothetical protein
LHRIVLTPATGKNLRAFAALFTGHRAFTGADAAGDIEGRWLNLSHRFGTPPRRAAAIIDEAQLAGLDVMGTLRGIWDSWEPERRAAQREGRASCLPGLVMLGNRVFAQGCGVAKTEEYRRWVDRLLINGTLEGPSVADCAAVAETFPCADAESPRCCPRSAPSWRAFARSRRRIASPPRLRPPGSCPARPRSKRQSKRIGG